MKVRRCSTTSLAVAACIALGSLTSAAVAQKSAASRADDDVSQLPLHTVSSKMPSSVALAIILSGDGGWAGIDRRIAEDLAGNGVDVVGLDSRSYLMKAHTPDEVAADIARMMRHFTAGWTVRRVALIGYSRGADLVPFIANRLPTALRGEISLIALLAPAERANFQFHWADLLSETSKPSDAPILPELERLRGTPVLCIYGKDEKESLCRLADTAAVRVERRPGRHHFDGDYDVIATEILRRMALDPIGR